MRHVVLSFLMVQEVENSLGLMVNQEMPIIHRDHIHQAIACHESGLKRPGFSGYLPICIS